MTPRSGVGFLMEATAAIRSGSGGPPSLGTFWLEQQLWQRLGLRRDDLRNRPWREVEDYLLYIDLSAREERAQQRRANNARR